jgi:subtilisin-like proprotein convertase family protein
MINHKHLSIVLLMACSVCLAGTKENQTAQLTQLLNQIDSGKAHLNQADLAELRQQYDAISIALGGDQGQTGSGGMSQLQNPRSAPPIPVNTSSTTTSVSGSPGSAISDALPVQEQLNVSAADTYIWDVDLTLEITHTFNADLDITLTSPSGTVVTITTDNGGGTNDVFNGTLFDDDAIDVTSTNIVTDFAYTNLTTATPLGTESALGAFIGEDPNGDWTLDIVDDAGGDNGTLVSWGLDIVTLDQTPVNDPVVNATSSPGLAISDAAPVQDVLSVSGAGDFVCDVNMTTEITHTFPADLDISLTSPAGTVAFITTDNGGGTDDIFNGTLWDDSATQSANDYAHANGVTSSPLVPEASMAAFIGEDPNGSWTLDIVDDAGGDAGTLVSWGLDVTACEGQAPVLPATPVPSLNYWAILFLILMVLGLTLRRAKLRI